MCLALAQLGSLALELVVVTFGFCFSFRFASSYALCDFALHIFDRWIGRRRLSFWAGSRPALLRALPLRHLDLRARLRCCAFTSQRKHNRGVDVFLELFFVELEVERRLYLCRVQDIFTKLRSIALQYPQKIREHVSGLPSPIPRESRGDYS